MIVGLAESPLAHSATATNVSKAGTPCTNANGSRSFSFSPNERSRNDVRNVAGHCRTVPNTATPTSPMPAKMRPRLRDRPRVNVATTSAKNPNTGIAKMMVVGCVNPKPANSANARLPLSSLSDGCRCATNTYSSCPMSTGMATSRPSEATSTDQVKNGTRRMFMPGARVVRMVVTSETAPARKPAAASAADSVNRSTKSALPPLGPPLLSTETTASTAPMSHAQKPAAASRGRPASGHPPATARWRWRGPPRAAASP